MWVSVIICMAGFFVLWAIASDFELDSQKKISQPESNEISSLTEIKKRFQRFGRA